MPRLTIALAVVAGLLAGGLATSLLLRPAPTQLDEAAVRAIASEVVAAVPAPTTDQAAIEAMVTEILSRRSAEAPPQSVAQLDAATLNPMIESYLLGNPRILQDVSARLDEEIRTAAATETKAGLTELKTAIYDDPDHIVLGNPDGDVTLVELFDYNCGYCRQALPDLATLLAEDPELKVILKEFPILSQESVDAARVGVLVNQTGADYWAFHQALFSSRGQVNGDTALKAAADMGLNRVTLELEMGSPKVTAILDKSYQIAQRLKITGTPTFILGDELIPGAVGIEQLRQGIANIRACGSTICPAGNG